MMIFCGVLTKGGTSLRKGLLPDTLACGLHSTSLGAITLTRGVPCTMYTQYVLHFLRREVVPAMLRMKPLLYTTC